jgi:hypothetical protein
MAVLNDATAWSSTERGRADGEGEMGDGSRENISPHQSPSRADKGDTWCIVPVVGIDVRSECAGGWSASGNLAHSMLSAWPRRTLAPRGEIVGWARSISMIGQTCDGLGPIYSFSK